MGLRVLNRRHEAFDEFTHQFRIFFDE
jgi:hypothetical protein